MLSTEHLRNKNQRLIPLTKELIRDMLENEGREYQTPPGGHVVYSSEEGFLTGTSLSSRWFINSKTAKHLPSWDGDNADRNLRLPSYRSSSYDKELTGQMSENTSDSESSDMEELLEVLRTFNRRKLRKDSKDKSKENKHQAKETEPVATEFLYIKPSRRPLYNTKSDSLICKKKSEKLEDKDGQGMRNFRATRLHWINMIEVNKSETSFVLNQFKMINHKLNSCNAYYKPTREDLKRDCKAFAALMGWNSKNAYRWRK